MKGDLPRVRRRGTLRTTFCGCRVVPGDTRWTWHPVGKERHPVITKEARNAMLGHDRVAIAAFLAWRDLPYEVA